MPPATRPPISPKPLARASSIHRTRVAIKRLRAWAALHRAAGLSAPESPESLGSYYAALGRRRARTALLAAAADLDLDAATLSRMRRATRSPENFPSDPPPVPPAAVARWMACIEALSPQREPLRYGLEVLAEKARRSARRAKKNPNPDRLHALRKRVKTLLYAAERAGPHTPESLRARFPALRRLGHLLGQARDLALLAEWASGRAPAFDPVPPLARDAAARRARKALALAKKAFARD